jgi:ketosteroid isomerase-like protein
MCAPSARRGSPARGTPSATQVSAPAVDGARRPGFNGAMRLDTLAVAGLALLACGPHRIPGTEISDTPDTRAVVAVIDAYRQAAERRDAAAVLALASPSYFDTAGTPDPSDDVDYELLKKRITADYQQITTLRLTLGVRRIDVAGDKATAYVFYEEHYRIQTKGGEVSKEASDSHRMLLVREGGRWFFVSGL